MQSRGRGDVRFIWSSVRVLASWRIAGDEPRDAAPSPKMVIAPDGEMI